MNKFKGIVELKINDEIRGFKFGILSTEMATKETGCSFGEFQKLLESGDLTAVINTYWAGAVCYAELKNKEIPTRREVADWIESMGDSEDVNKNISEAFGVHQDPNKPAPETGQ